MNWWVERSPHPSTVHVNVIESRGSSFSGRGWEEVVANRDEEEEEEEEGESSDVGSVCGRNVVYGLRARGMGGLLVVEKAAGRN